MNKKNKLLLYTFRTFSYLDKISLNYPDIFIFGKLKEDIIKFECLVNELRPKHIFGFALTKNKSRFEKNAANRFNKGKISKGGENQFKLYYPTNGFLNIGLSIKSTTTFCNWTMYKVEETIKETNIKFSFVHVKASDLNDLYRYLNSI